MVSTGMDMGEQGRTKSVVFSTVTRRDGVRLGETVRGRQEHLRHPLLQDTRELTRGWSASERESFEGMVLVLAEFRLDELGDDERDSSSRGDLLLTDEGNSFFEVPLAHEDDLRFEALATGSREKSMHSPFLRAK